jgi:cell division protein FtsL
MTLMNVAAVATRRLPMAWLGFSGSRAPKRHAPDTVASVRARAKAGERRPGFALVLGPLVVVAVALLLVWVRLQVVNAGYELSTARRLAHRLEQEQRELEIEVATLTSPRRLEQVARQRLGMGPPAPGQIVSVP